MYQAGIVLEVDTDCDHIFDEYVHGTPERQARYIHEFRIKQANLRTVLQYARERQRL
jgi:hypothetical protein